MKLVTIGLFIAVVLSFVIAACGKQIKVTKGELLTFKTLAEVRCPVGQYVEPPIVVKELLNGDITGYVVQCVGVGE